ncbi:IclR family transcriptional regulator [Pararobbsia silviterrae]|uniref:IclR family transcriptional regulator n=1 Tax=Pararobbsia silviterrae TaxID=1792498 RepID=A0A494XQ42_9BURK|nr:IclR family transcriptional regulator [Pararobbsia silviterrae]RKP49653.1 IclR family transcriptional regulator [Pararobbsia silviterrae]
MTSVRDRALAIVELLAHNVRGLPMSEIGDRLDIPRTAAHRVLADLKESGYVKQDMSTSHYMLTFKMASLGLSYLAATGITDAAQPLLDELAETSGELVRLAVAEADDLIWVAKAQGARTGLRYDPDAGLDIYLPATANGIAYLAALSDERALALVARQGMDKARDMGPGAPQTLRALMDEVQAARERGYAFVVEAYEAGTSALAAAIRVAGQDAPIGTVSIAGPSIRLTRDRMDALAAKVIACAEALALVNRSSPVFARSPSRA